jgi:hypothetical protein
MEALIEMAKSVLGPEPGVTLLLFILLAGALAAFWREKTKNDQVAIDRLREAREDTELLVETVNEAVNTVREFKSSNDALRGAFEALVKECHDRSLATSKSGEGA